MADVIFMTGATGFLGTELAAGLIRCQAAEKIYVLVRAADSQEALHRLREAWYHERALYEAAGGRIVPVTGDFTKTGLNLDEETRREMESTVSLVIHAGAVLVTGCKVTDLEITGREVTAVHARCHGRKRTFRADLVVLAAGGLGTPPILENSGITCEKSLFVDPVLCVAGHLPGLRQDRQILMPFISQQEGYILAPYMDYLSFFFNKDWRMPMRDIASIMIKLADEETGSIHGKKIDKQMSEADNRRMKEAVMLTGKILVQMGVPEEKQFLGTLNAGHPGGMLPLTPAQKDTLHHAMLPDNLYVADATILPKAMGNPPILTIMALARRMAALV